MQILPLQSLTKKKPRTQTRRLSPGTTSRSPSTFASCFSNCKPSTLQHSSASPPHSPLLLHLGAAPSSPLHNSLRSIGRLYPSLPSPCPLLPPFQPAEPPLFCATTAYISSPHPCCLCPGCIYRATRSAPSLPYARLNKPAACPLCPPAPLPSPSPHCPARLSHQLTS